jgi:Methyltransferase domain
VTFTDDQLRVMAVEAHTRHRAQQNIGELAEILAAVQQTKPQRLLEIGVGEGGTLWAWAQLGIPQVLAVTEPVPGPEWVHHHGADLLFADSHTPEARQWVTERLGKHWLDVLFIDGDHSYEGVRADWEDYSPLVRPAGLVIIHDIRFMDEVCAWWREFKASPQPPGRVLAEIYAGGDGLPAAPGAGFITIE